MLQILILLSCICLHSSNARPADEPTRFVLNNVQNDSKNALLSKLKQIEQVNSDAANSIIKFDKPNQSRRLAQSTMPSVPLSPKKEKTVLINENNQAILEKQGIDPIKQFFNDLLNPMPIIDRIKEEDKYGNMGNSEINRAFINIFENFSNFINALLDPLSKPSNQSISSARSPSQFNKKIMHVLQEVGTQIIGL